MGANLTIAVGEKDPEVGYMVVKFNGEFDKAGHTEVRERLDKLVEGFDGTDLVFDFENLSFINSEGIGYLMEIHAHMVKAGKGLVILSLKEHIADVFEAIGIQDIIPIFDDLDGYLAK